MLQRALAATIVNDGQPIAWAGIEGTPYAQAGMGLFVGVGFDFGVVAATAGILGSLSLARIDVPAFAGAGIVMDIQDDGSLALPLPSYLQGLKDIAHLTAAPVIPVRKFAFDLSFRYGAQLDLCMC